VGEVTMAVPPRRSHARFIGQTDRALPPPYTTPRGIIRTVANPAPLPSPARVNTTTPWPEPMPQRRAPVRNIGTSILSARPAFRDRPPPELAQRPNIVVQRCPPPPPGN